MCNLLLLFLFLLLLLLFNVHTGIYTGGGKLYQELFVSCLIEDTRCYLACTDDRTEEGKFFLLKHDKVKGEYICS